MALILYYAKHRKNPFIRPITQTAGGNKDFARLRLGHDWSEFATEVGQDWSE